MNLKEFSGMILPCEDTRLRNIVLIRRPHMRVNRIEFLHPDVESAICDIFLMEIELMEKMASLKLGLMISRDYSLTAAYNTLDNYRRGTVNQFVLESFFKRNLYYMSFADIMAIIRRFDTSGDAHISLQEFSEFMNFDE